MDPLLRDERGEPQRIMQAEDALWYDGTRGVPGLLLMHSHAVALAPVHDASDRLRPLVVGHTGPYPVHRFAHIARGEPRNDFRSGKFARRSIGAQGEKVGAQLPRVRAAVQPPQLPHPSSA